MNTAKQRETDAREVYERFWECYQKGDLDGFASKLDDNFEMIGTSASEICHSKEEGVAFFKAQMEELVGKAEMRNREISVKLVKDLVLINEASDIYVLNESEWVYYSKIRISTLLHETELGWKVIQQHGSLPDMRVQEGETIAIEKINRENLELRDAVMRRTQELAIKNRELEIEAALERVRAVAMGMKSSADMFHVCRVISDELSQFGIQGIRNIQAVIIQEKRKIYDCYQYFPAYQSEILEHTEYLKNPVESALVNRMLEAKDGYFEGSLTGQELEEFRTHRKKENYLADPLMDGVNEIFYFFYSIGPGALGITLYQDLSPDGLVIFKRFHQVFSLAYARFRDIEKAEARAREIEIDLALERVRAETMAMHSSEDVGKCILKMFGELTALGVYEGTRFGIGILNHDNNNNQLWTARKDGEDVKMHIGHLDMTWHPLLKSARKAWKAQTPLHEYILEGEDLLDYYRMLNNAPDYKIQIAIEKLPKREIQYCFIFEHGFFYAFSPQEFQPELIQTVQRFTTQFAQTYRRYLDLVNAEAQARESEIQLALERVRARSLAMHQSDELKHVIEVVFDQMVALKIPVEHAGFIIDYKQNEDMHIWLADHQQGVPNEITIPYFDSPHWNSYHEAKANGASFFANLLPFEVKNKFYQDLFQLIPELPKEAQEVIFSKPALAISTVLLDHVGLYMENYADTPFSEAENGILMRFGKVFEQAYTRFLDLQKAETQTRESQINLAVERVRAQSMAMHHPDDLDKVNKEILSQLNWLQVPGLTGVTFYLVDELGWVRAWDFSSPGNIGDQTSYTLQFDSNKHEMLGFPFKTLRQTDLDYFVADYPLEKLEKAVYEFEEIDPAMAKIVKEALSTGALTHQWTACARISNGMLGIDLVSPPSEDTKTIGLKIAGAFNQAYIRFLDLKKAEAQAREAKIEAALERIRSKSLSMFKTDDLRSVVTVLFEQMQELSVDMGFASVSIFIFENGARNIIQWIPLPDGVDSISIPYFEHPISSDLFDAKETGADYFEKVYSLEEKNTWLEAGFELSGYKDLPEEFKKSLLEAPGYAMSITLAKNSGICIPSFEGTLPSKDDVAIMKRVGKVFEQAYIRFLDLQKAEAQARESEIQLALERVRAKTMAMHSSSDLGSTSAVLFQQIADLGFETWSCGFCIWKEDDHIEAWMGADTAGSSLSPILLNYKEETTHYEIYKSFLEGESSHERVWEGLELEAHYDYMQTIPSVKTAFSQLFAAGLTLPTYQCYNIGFFKQGYLMIITKKQNPELKDLSVRFANVFEQTYTRFLDLQKAEAQTREAEIELALERVRARTMAMQHSDELAEASFLLDQQVRSLGIRTRGCAFHIYSENDSSEWFSSEQGTMPVYHTPRENVFLEYYEAGHRGETIYIKEFAGEVCAAHYDYLCTLPVMGEALKELKASGGSFPERQIDHATFFKYGYLLFITLEDVPDSHDIFKRFAKVFEQTYTRFLDLQKAEAQAREAKIEAALEKIRARTMGMQHSDELPEAANLLFLEVQALGIPSWSAGYNILADDKKSAMCWMSSQGALQKPFQLRLWGEDSFDEMREFILSDQTMLVQELGGKAIEDHYRHMKSFPDLKPTFDEIDEKGLSLPTYQINHLCKFTQGFVLFITYEKVPEAHDIFQRFTKVFEQTFTRFVDLKKAEAQAREAKIEASLERLRAQSMAMHQSEDLILSTSILFEELEKLDLSIERSGIGIFDPETKDCDLWTCVISPKGKVELVRGVTSLTIHPMLVKTFDAWLEKRPFSYVLEGQELLDYYGIVSTSDFHLSKDAIETSTALPKEYYSYTPFGAGGLYFFAANEPKESDNEIVRRFAKVFDQTYTRFLDLQKAEAQIRNEKIKNALERVRSRSLAMHKSAELTEVIQTVSEQFKELEIDISGGAFIVINQDLEKGFYCWGAGGVGNYVRKVKIPFIDRPIYQTLSNGIKNANPFFTEYYDVEEKRAFFKHLFKYHPFKDTPSSRQESLLAEESDYARSCVVSKNTSIFIINHDGKQFSEEENELLREMGRVFEQAYIRFIDLEKAEKQARLISEERDRLEITLDELKATQAQLIQQEKLASLGQLTAGIAHEIKNPLNFVNNFSDLSRELIDEVFEELENLEASATKEEIIAILQDVQSNLTKVHEHGSRADSIVTSMLQHSRASGSKREPKAFNPLIKEFVNLSFHGMRAGKAPINVDIDLQLDPAVGEVNLISEDFSRVILNLCNNAFDAMRDKLKLEVGSGKPEAYLAKLTVKTALQKDKVILSIGDNGGGIPKEIQDKILQPFFTTKKGTEGTGLGLSITHDIVKAHGGELRVETAEGKGSEFRILLPI